MIWFSEILTNYYSVCGSIINDNGQPSGSLKDGIALLTIELIITCWFSG